MQLDEPLNVLREAIHYSFIKFCIYCFPLWYKFLVHYTLRVEKNYQHGLDGGPMEYQFLRPRGCLTIPFRTLLLCFRVTGKTPGLVSCSNLVKNNFCLYWPSWYLGKMTHSSLCSGARECGTKHSHSLLSLPHALSGFEESQSWGCSKILLSFMMRFNGHFWPYQQ
jgi:hypothetical protein